MKQTEARIQAPTALTVGLDDQIGGICFAFFDDGGMRILATRDVAAACARIPEVMPVVVVTTPGLSPGDSALLEEHTSAVGAVLLAISKGTAKEAVLKALGTAMSQVASRG